MSYVVLRVWRTRQPGTSRQMPSSKPAAGLSIVIRPPGSAPYTLTLDQLCAHVRAARTLKMGRLADKLAKASDAIAGLETAVERDVDKLIERTEEVHKRRENAFMRKHAALDGHVSDLTEFEKDLEAFDGKNDHSNDGESNGNAYVGTNPK